jgi:hypothetical protein
MLVRYLLMGRAARRFVAKAQKDVGWRVWDNLARQFWGPVFPSQPDAILAELNGARRGRELNRLVAAAKRMSR